MAFHWAQKIICYAEQRSSKPFNANKPQNQDKLTRWKVESGRMEERKVNDKAIPSAVHEWKQEGDFNITSTTSATWRCCCCGWHACRPVTSRKSCSMSEMIFRTMNEPLPQRRLGSKKVHRRGAQLANKLYAKWSRVFVCVRALFISLGGCDDLD